MDLNIDIVEDDLEILEILNVGFPRRIYLRPDLFHLYNEPDFFRRFRLTKATILQLLPLIEGNLERPYNRNNLVTPMNQLLIGLMYFSSNSHMIIISDIAQTDVSCISRIVNRVARSIAALSRRFIKFPQNQNSVNDTKNRFYDIAQFPNIIGALDGTHIRIKSPGGPDAEVYRNRKHYFSINVQAICDAKLEFINLVARWPGSAHDATILNNSHIRRRFENNEFPNCFLLGDGAYPLREYILTPIENPQFPAEMMYNQRQIQTRNSIERVFGIWKRRFPILAYGCRLKLRNVLPVIIATGVLFNIARRNGEPEPPLPHEIDEHELQVLIQQGNIPVVPHINNDLFRGIAARNNLVWNFFNAL